MDVPKLINVSSAYQVVSFFSFVQNVITCCRIWSQYKNAYSLVIQVVINSIENNCLWLRQTTESPISMISLSSSESYMTLHKVEQDIGVCTVRWEIDIYTVHSMIYCGTLHCLGLKLLFGNASVQVPLFSLQLLQMIPWASAVLSLWDFYGPDFH